MKGKNHLISLALLISMFGVLALVGQGYVVCQNDDPDEFLELTGACQIPTFSVFAPNLNNHLFLFISLRMLSFQGTDLYMTCPRC